MCLSGQINRAPQWEDIRGQFKGFELAPIEKESFSVQMPWAEAAPGAEANRLYQLTSLVSGFITIKTLPGSSIRAAEVWRYRPELVDGELARDRQVMVNGNGPAELPVQKGQTYAILLSMSTGTAGAKSGTIEVSQKGGPVVTEIKANGSVGTWEPSLTVSLPVLDGNAFVAGKSYKRSLKFKSNLPGGTLQVTGTSTDSANVGVSVASVTQVGGNAEGTIPVTIKTSPKMMDATGTVTLTITAKSGSTTITKKVEAPYSVTTYWLESAPYHQSAGDVRINASWKFNSSGYMMYNTDVWGKSIAFPPTAYFGFYFNPPISNDGAKLGFTGEESTTVDWGTDKHWYRTFEGYDSRLVDFFDKFQGFGIALGDNEQFIVGWKNKHKIQQLNLKWIL